MAYYEVYIPNETEPRICTAIRRLRNLPQGTIIWRTTEGERYPVRVVNGRAKYTISRKSATPSNNRVQRTGGESGSQSSLFAVGDEPAKVTRQSTRR